MSISPLNPAFGDPPEGYGQHQVPDRTQGPPASINQFANGSAPGQYPAMSADVGTANAEITSIANAIEELQSRLERATSQLGHASAVRTTELEIGRLFVEAQRFSETSISKLEQQVQDILAEAESKALQILREATDEAQEIRRQAQESAFVSARAAEELQSAIAGFTVVNSALVTELNALNTMLMPSTEQTITTFDRPSGTMGTR